MEKTVEMNICSQGKADKLEEVATVHNNIDGNGQIQDIAVHANVLNSKACLIKSIDSEREEHRRTQRLRC